MLELEAPTPIPKADPTNTTVYGRTYLNYLEAKVAIGRASESD